MTNHHDQPMPPSQSLRDRVRGREATKGIIVDSLDIATVLNYIAPYQADALVWTDTLGPAVQRLQVALAEPEDDRVERLAQIIWKAGEVDPADYWTMPWVKQARAVLAAAKEETS